MIYGATSVEILSHLTLARTNTQEKQVVTGRRDSAIIKVTSQHRKTKQFLPISNYLATPPVT